jgi:hypothetical protein
MDNLRDLWAEGGAAAREQARDYANRYRDRRAVMVFDCVMSRQRTYQSRVLPLVDEFAKTPNAASLRVLAEQGPGLAGPSRSYPFMRGDANAIRGVAAGLVRFCDERQLDEEEGVRFWAAEAAPWERRPKGDSYVGSVKGIGIATFAYLRMRSGADAIKPDVRVNAALGSLLFPLGDGSDLAVLCVAGAAAEELGVSRLELDQLLWWMEQQG